MSTIQLQESFIDELSIVLPSWKYVTTRQHFKRPFAFGNQLIHVTFIRHPKDVDAVIDVAVEFRSGKSSVSTIGASLGNILSRGQVRHSLTSVDASRKAAREAFTLIEEAGISFFERYSTPESVVRVLRDGGSEAMLIMPISARHGALIAELENVV